MRVSRLGRRAMEYGAAINPENAERAVKLARDLGAARPEMPLEQIAREAVARSYCTCVTGGEDMGENRLSDIHRRLVEDVAARLEPHWGLHRGTRTGSTTPVADRARAGQDVGGNDR